VYGAPPGTRTPNLLIRSPWALLGGPWQTPDETRTRKAVLIPTIRQNPPTITRLTSESSNSRVVVQLIAAQKKPASEDAG